MGTAAARAGAAGGSPTGSRRAPEADRNSRGTDFWFERSQAYAAAGELARQVLDGVDDDGSSGSALREGALALVSTVAAAVSTSRAQLAARLEDACDRANGLAGLFVLYADQVQMSAERQKAYRENLSAVSGLLFGLKRSITQDR